MHTEQLQCFMKLNMPNFKVLEFKFILLKYMFYINLFSPAGSRISFFTHYQKAVFTLRFSVVVILVFNALEEHALE